MGVFLGVIEPRVEERPLAAHLGVRDVGVPVGHRAPAGPCVVVHTREAERGREQRGGGLPIRTEGFAVMEELGIEFPRPPGRERLLERLLIDAQAVRQRLRVRGEQDDLPHIKIPVRPAVQAMADTL